jgi:hypothetical protein
VYIPLFLFVLENTVFSIEKPSIFADTTLQIVCSQTAFHQQTERTRESERRNVKDTENKTCEG